jgi:hypothetical protein
MIKPYQLPYKAADNTLFHKVVHNGPCFPFEIGGQSKNRLRWMECMSDGKQYL